MGNLNFVSKINTYAQGNYICSLQMRKIYSSKCKIQPIVNACPHLVNE